VDARGARIAANEALFREVNERLQSLNEAFATLTDTFEIACECGDSNCLEQLTVPRELYERVRSEATLFFVRPGHVSPEVEDVVEQHEGFDVVQKRKGMPRAVAEATDPRR
jgi:hypothetical protein